MWFPAQYLAARCGRALLGGRYPPSLSFLVATRINHSRRFGGSQLLVVGPLHAMCWERALPTSVSCIRLPLVLVSCPSGGLLAVPTYLVPRGRWIERKPCRRQYSLLAAQVCAVLGHGAVGAGGMPVQGTHAVSDHRRALLWVWRRRRPKPTPSLLFSAAGHALPVSWVVGGVPSPPRTRPSSTSTSSPLVATPGVLSLQGNSATPGVSIPCGDSPPPRTPWRPPPGFSATP